MEVALILLHLQAVLKESVALPQVNRRNLRKDR